MLPSYRSLAAALPDVHLLLLLSPPNSLPPSPPLSCSLFSHPPRQVFAEDCSAYRQLVAALGPDHVARPLFEAPPSPAENPHGVICAALSPVLTLEPT